MLEDKSMNYTILGIEINLSASFMIYLSLVTTVLSIVSSFLTKYLDKKAAGESFVIHFYEGMTAYINWLPHQGKI